MTSAYNMAIVLLRFSGVLFVSLGLLGLMFIGQFAFISLRGAPDWFSQSVAPFAIQSMLASPLYIIGGCLIIRFSRRLTQFIIKFCTPKETVSGE
jgi:hypothetical protein